jgi:collagenase-like PrtC family protease
LKYKKLYIKELERKFPSIIIENDFGTSIYSAYDLTLIDKLDILEKNNIDYIFIDSYLHDSKWLNKTINLYIDALCDKNYPEKKDIYFEKNKKIAKSQNLSHGFFSSDKSELYYLKKEIIKDNYE